VAIGFGAIGAAVGLASILGPMGGGWLIDSFGWRVAFTVLAISAALIFLSALAIEKKSTTLTVKFDFLGTVLFAPSMVLIIIALMKIGTWQWEKVVLLFIIGVILLILFLIYEFKLEKKEKFVLFPSIFLKSKSARAGLVMTSLIFFISGGLAFALTTYLQVVLGYDALITGVVLAVNAIGIIIFSIGTPLIIKNINPRLVCQLSVLLAALSGVVIAIGIDPTTLNFLFFLGTFIAGVAIGLLSSQAGIIVTSTIGEEYAALSGGIQGAMRNIGQAIGIALIGLIVIFALTASVKNHFLKSPEIQAQIKHEIYLQKAVPFLSDKQVDNYLNKTHLNQKAKNKIIQINNTGRLHSLHVTFFSFAVICLLFMFFTFSIPVSFARESLKKEGDTYEENN